MPRRSTFTCGLPTGCMPWKADRMVTWTALKAQFGTGFSKLYDFKNKFPGTLALAQAVYPEAKLAVADEGVVLKPSKPPVSPKLISAG